jgi:hypothetical protein
LSNVRTVKGTAVYNPTDSTITVPTTPLTAITNTSLLTCQSNRFRDNSSNNLTITRNGDVRVTNFAPFAVPSSYSIATNGGSGYFDGTGDYLSVPTNSALSFGTGDFTIEFWMYMTSYGSANQDIIDFRGSTGSGTHPAIYLENVSGTGTKQLRLFNGTSDVAVTANNFPLNTWQHIAATRNGTELKFFVNGSQVGSTSTNSTNYTNANGVWIGAYSGNIANYFGYLSNVRVVTGTALYTGTFTPPTSPEFSISGTSLLLNFTNGNIVDLAAKNNLETVGNARVNTSVTKFNTGSLFFDGSGDQLLGTTSPDLVFGIGDFSIEAWVYQTQRNTLSDIISCHNYGVTADWLWSINNSGNLFFQISSSGTGAQTSSSTVPLNTWTHVSVTRQNGTVRQFINGVQTSSATYSTSIANTIRLSIGSATNLNASSTFYGYIDDLRVTRGVARYTANFTPPTESLPTK